jgi:hypothetical protein
VLERGETAARHCWHLISIIPGSAGDLEDVRRRQLASMVTALDTRGIQGHMHANRLIAPGEQASMRSPRRVTAGNGVSDTASDRAPAAHRSARQPDALRPEPRS